jgi:hypothetical protein
MKQLTKKERSEVIERYCSCMVEVKLRTEVITGFLLGTVSAKYLPPNVESVCLQFRKILELIALGSLIAHKEDYSRQRANFAQDWHAAKILKAIEKINPAFYPVPTKQILDASGKVVRVEDVRDPYLTRGDFVNLYQTCSSLLHASNPFGKPKDYAGFWKTAPNWRAKIMTLLNHHQIQLPQDDLQLWVIMENKDDGKPWGFFMQKVGIADLPKRQG